MVMVLESMAVIDKLIGCEHRTDPWIRHGVMLQLAGDVLFGCFLVGGSNADDGIIAMERFG